MMAAPRGFGNDRETTNAQDCDRITAVFERRISEAITTQTRTLVFSQLGALVVIAAVAFGLQ